jgi:hypothetical protein
MKERIKLKSGILRCIGKGLGYVKFRWDRYLDGGPPGFRTTTHRDFQISRGERRQWEISVWDNESKDWVLSSGYSPEGVFNTCASALEALVNYAGGRP